MTARRIWTRAQRAKRAPAETDEITTNGENNVESENLGDVAGEANGLGLPNDGERAEEVDDPEDDPENQDENQTPARRNVSFFFILLYEFMENNR